MLIEEIFGQVRENSPAAALQAQAARSRRIEAKRKYDADRAAASDAKRRAESRAKAATDEYQRRQRSANNAERRALASP